MLVQQKKNADTVCLNVELYPWRTKRWCGNGIYNSTIVIVIMHQRCFNRSEVKLGFVIIDMRVAAMAKTQGRAHIFRVVMMIPTRATNISKYHIMPMPFVMY